MGFPSTISTFLVDAVVVDPLCRAFEVIDGIYQVQGYDLSNISFVEGASGVIVFDAGTAMARHSISSSPNCDHPLWMMPPALTCAKLARDGWRTHPCPRFGRSTCQTISIATLW